MNLFNFIKKKKLHEKIKCPRCNIQMRQITRETITIDVCKECGGMWLDKGEIQQLNKLEQKIKKQECKKKEK